MAEVTLEHLDVEHAEARAAKAEDDALHTEQLIEGIREQEQATAAANDQALAAQNDPRNRENWGIGAVVEEVKAAIGGGVQDTASSLVTLPERAIDMVTGEAAEEAKTEEGYRAESDDWFVDDDNPIVTKTWWGGAIRGLTHFGTMALAIVPALKATGVAAVGGGMGVGIARAASWVSGSSLAKGAAIGGALDLTSKYSQEDNAMGIVKERWGFLDTPLATKNDDHPAMKTLKNVVEGMMFGFLFDGARLALKGPTDSVVKKIASRNESVDSQIRTMGKAQYTEQLELGIDEFGGYKNKKIADSWQAAPTSTENAISVKNSLDEMRTKWGSEMGSPGSVTTPISMKRWVQSSRLGEQELDKIARDLMSDAKYQRMQADMAAGRTTLAENQGRTLELAQRTIEGRNSSGKTPNQFWSEFFAANETLRVDPDGTAIPVFAAKNIGAADLVVGSLMREIRDLGYTGRELFDIADLGDIDGPAAALRDKVITGLTEIKRSKLAHSDTFRGLGVDTNPGVKQAFDEQLDNSVQQSLEAMDVALKYAADEPDDDLFKAVFESVSMMDDVHNLTDFDNFIRKKLVGGEFNGRKQTGLLIRELQGVMVNSILSGPKTPGRAIMGTATATFLRPIATAAGAALRYPFTGDAATLRASLASTNAMREAIPEAWTLFKTRLNSYWSGDIATVRSRYSEYTKGDEQWALFGDWVENSGRATAGDKAAYYMANMARGLNDNKFLTYSTKIMAATDDTFGYILGRARAKELAMREAMDRFNKGTVTEITPRLLKDAEDRFLGKILDADGNILDDAVEFAKREATLTTDLTGFSKGLNDVFNSTPWAKPFFLFARTGVNGLALTAKHTPGFNFLVKEWNDIAFASADNLADVAKYGINTPEDLINAKALQGGRLAIGSSVISMAGFHFMNGGLTGNGPTDRQKRQVWLDAGWVPRSINIGGVWVGYDSFEPFNQILSIVADVGDHSQLMGEEWTQDQFQKLALVIAQGAASKSYLQGIQQFVDLFAGRPGQQNRIIAGLMNNTIPLAGLRNDLGKIFTPHTKELGSGITDHIRNRNLISEGISGDPLPIKYDMLNGRPVKNYDFPTRMWNALIPIPLNLDQGPGRKLLFDSGYDLRMSTYYAPDGTDLTESPKLRSLFQQAIGKQNLEVELDKLSKDPRVKASIAAMYADLNAGRREMDPMNAYLHNKLIKRLFDRARKRAWASIKLNSEAQRLIEEERNSLIQNRKRLKQTSELKAVLQLNK